jgi:hypothetical protein
LVPVKNGAIPEDPEGKHSTQAGTLLDLAAVPGADEPPDPDCPGGAAEVVERAEPTPTPELTPAETPAGELFEPAAPFDGVVVPGNVTAPYGFVRPVPAMPEVWAAADSPTRTENSNAMQSCLAINPRSLLRRWYSARNRVLTFGTPTSSSWPRKRASRAAEPAPILLGSAFALRHSDMSNRFPGASAASVKPAHPPRISGEQTLPIDKLEFLCDFSKWSIQSVCVHSLARPQHPRIPAFVLTTSRLVPEKAVISLFFRSLRRRNPRISAEKEPPSADNFL